MAARGMFITFEGGDGSGKSTQIQSVRDWFESRGREVIVTREPGGTELGTEIRRLVQNGPEDVDARTEALLYAADRAYHVATVIRPALERGAVVLGDRYIDSSLAYQGAARSLGVDEIASLSAWATQGLYPSLTFLLDLPPEVGARRRTDAPDRMERESMDFHERVRHEYLRLADAEPERIVVIDAVGTVDEVFSEIRGVLVERFEGGVATIDEAVDAPELVAAMDEVRSIVSAAHALRKTHQLRVRQPLASLLVVSENFAALEPFADLIASEVNVKSVVFSAPQDSGLSVRTELALNPRAFDPAVRKLTSQLFKAQKSGEWEVVDGECRFASVELDGAPLVLTGDMFSVSTSVDAAEGQVADVLASGTFVVLDTELTPELEAEGYARDVVRAVQDERKNAGLHIADRIDLSLTVPSDHVADVETWRDMIAAETLALSLTVEAGDKLAVSVAKH